MSSLYSSSYNMLSCFGRQGKKSVLKWVCLWKEGFCGLLVFWRLSKSAYFSHRPKITHQTTPMRLWKATVTWLHHQIFTIKCSWTGALSAICYHLKKNSLPRTITKYSWLVLLIKKSVSLKNNREQIQEKTKVGNHEVNIMMKRCIWRSEEFSMLWHLHIVYEVEFYFLASWVEYAAV